MLDYKLTKFKFIVILTIIKTKEFVLKNSEKQQLKLRIKRLGLFMVIVLIPILVICSLLIIAKVPQWLNILVLVIIMFVLFFLYMFICSKLDERKEKRMQDKKDPFSD